nr:carbohydrate kinase family protein [uncultured Clostridium sp.]
MRKGKKAVVAGHICIDITPVFPLKEIQQVNKVLVPGKLIQMDGVNISTGGAVANTGLALKLMGIDVSLMGKIGEDAFGSLVLNCLEKYEATDGMIISEDSDTSYSVVLAVPGIDRIFLHNPGANYTFSYEDLDISVIGESSLFHFGYPTLMKKMYQNQGAELIRILKKVKEMEVAVSLDMAAVDPDSEAGQEEWDRTLTAILPYVDFFVPSVEELCYMLDKRRYESWQREANGRDITEIVSICDIKPLGQKVIELGAKIVLIKCGAAGIYYRTAEADKLGALCSGLNLSLESWAGKEGFEPSYVPEAVISGTGAGDTCIAAFLASVLKENSLEKSLQLATAQGACCVAAYDALGGLRTLEELEKKIQKGWKKQI